MAIERFTLRETPVITASLETGDTVTVTVYNKAGSSVPLDTNSATENVVSSGKYDYTLDFTTKPTSGKNYYDIKFTGTYQDVWKTFSWDEIVSEFGGKVCIDTVGGTAGQGFPIGTDDTPSDNLADAKAIADRNSFTQFCIGSILTLDRALDGYQFIGNRQSNIDIITLNNQSVNQSSFEAVTLTGQCNGNIFCTRCFLNSVTDFNGTINETAINTSLSVSATGTFTGYNVFGNSSTGLPPVMDLQSNAAAVVGLAGFSGLLQINNLVGGVVLIGGNGILTLDSTCTGGIVLLSGHRGNLTDNSGAGCIVLDYRDANVSDIWNAVRSLYTATGSMGETMRFMQAFTGGRIRLNATTNQLELYDEDNATLIASFDVTDFAGNAAVRNTADRQRV